MPVSKLVASGFLYLLIWAREQAGVGFRLGAVPKGGFEVEKASIDALESIETDTCTLVRVLNCNPVPPDGAGLAVSADVALHHRMRMPVISISDEMTGTVGRRCDAFSIEAPVGIRCVQRQLNRHPVIARSGVRLLYVAI